MTLEKKFELLFHSSFLDFGMAKGLEINKESTSYTKIEVKLHKTLHLFPFRNLQLAIETISLVISEVFLKQARSATTEVKT